jgi:hypothetical protein
MRSSLRAVALGVLVAAASCGAVRAAGAAATGALRGAPQDRRAQSGSCTTSSSFEYLLLVQDWPATECESTFPCQNGVPGVFTLHGAGVRRPA